MLIQKGIAGVYPPATSKRMRNATGDSAEREQVHLLYEAEDGELERVADPDGRASQTGGTQAERRHVMAQCIECNKRVGFFKKRYTASRKGPFCKECFRPRLAVCMLYMHQAAKAEDTGSISNAKAAAWVALCHLVCAERVNIVRHYEHALGASLGSRSTWQASKQKAQEYAGRANALLLPNSPGKTFTQAILDRASSLQAPRSKEVHGHSISSSPGPLFASYTHTLEDVAILSGEASIADVEETLKSLPGHDWLGRKALDTTLAAVKRM